VKPWNNVAIVGVGLIGGSVGLALRQRGLAEAVTGIGRRAESLRVAKRVGAVTRTTTDLAGGVAEADLVVVCTPVADIAGHVREAAASCNGAVITDAGSTKAYIVAELDGALPPTARFVGSHPLAGSERSGPAHARADLFVDRVVVVTPTGRTTADDLQTVTQFWKSLGAKIIEMTPTAHDRALAATSHLPHLVAFALAASVPPRDLPLAASGLRDTTRIAGSDPELWAQILVSNQFEVLKALDRFEQSTAALRQALEAGDKKRLVKLLTQAKRKRDALGS
jgi:cyclohexadieny/prephenate dehydrogenase